MVILLLISIIAVVVMNCLSNYVGKKYICEAKDTYLFNRIQYFVPFVIFLCISLTQKISWFAVVFGFIFGIFTVLSGVSKLVALSIGPMYITNLIITSSMIIPTVSGVFFGEKLSYLKIIFILFLVFFLFITTFKKENNKSFSTKWLIFSIVAFLFCGAIGVLQKIFRSTEFGDQTSPFLASAFLVSFLYSFFKARGKHKKNNKNFVVTAIICGVCVYLCNHINLYLSGIIESQLFFPLVNGIPLVLCSILAFTVFKEKFKPIQMIGLIGGIACLILICLV